MRALPSLATTTGLAQRTRGLGLQSIVSRQAGLQSLPKAIVSTKITPPKEITIPRTLPVIALTIPRVRTKLLPELVPRQRAQLLPKTVGDTGLSFPSPTPPINFGAPVPPIVFPSRGIEGKPRRGKRRVATRKTTFTPSVIALTFGIFGKPIKGKLTGFELRPIPSRAKLRRAGRVTLI